MFLASAEELHFQEHPYFRLMMRRLTAFFLALLAVQPGYGLRRSGSSAMGVVPKRAVYGVGVTERSFTSCALALRGGGEAKKLSPNRSFFGMIKAFIVSFFDPAFGGAYGKQQSVSAEMVVSKKAAGRAPVACAKGGVRTITVDDLKQMEGGCVQGIKTDAELNRAIASKKLSVVDFWASWCGPCMQMKPKFAKISDRYKGANFYAVDVDAAKPVSQKHNVASMPTFVFFKNGREIDRFSGADEAKLFQLVERYK